MTLIATQGIFMPSLYAMDNTPQLTTTTVIDATGEKFAWIGRVWNRDRVTKNITRVGFRFGNIVKAGGSALIISLQNVDLAIGAPFQPDGIQDQTVAIANANASFATNAWIRTDALNANRTVAFGEMLAVVVEYDGAGRLGSDSVVVTQFSGSSNTLQGNSSGGSLFTASWAAQVGYNNIILEFDDGSFGTLGEAMPSSGINTHAFNSGSVVDEHALAFTLPFKCKIDGLYAYLLIPAGADFDLVLYAGMTQLASASFDANQIRSNSGARWFIGDIAEQTLNSGTQYYLSIKPTTATSVTGWSFDVSDANHFQVHPGGINWRYSNRVDAGSWAAIISTRRLLAGIRISALSDDIGGAAPSARRRHGFAGMGIS